MQSWRGSLQIPTPICVFGRFPLQFVFSGDSPPSATMILAGEVGIFYLRNAMLGFFFFPFTFTKYVFSSLTTFYDLSNKFFFFQIPKKKCVEKVG